MHIRTLPLHELIGRQAKRRRFASLGDYEDVQDDFRLARHETRGVHTNENLVGLVAFRSTFSLAPPPPNSDFLGVDVYDEENDLADDEEEEYCSFLEFSPLDHNVAQKIWNSSREPRVFRPYVNNPAVLNVSEFGEETLPVVGSAKSSQSKPQEANHVLNTNSKGTKLPNTCETVQKKTPSVSTPSKTITISTSKPKCATSPLPGNMKLPQQKHQSILLMQQDPEYRKGAQSPGTTKAPRTADNVDISQQDQRVLAPEAYQKQHVGSPPPQHVLFQHQWGLYQKSRERQLGMGIEKMQLEDHESPHNIDPTGLDARERDIICLDKHQHREEIQRQQALIMNTTNPASVQEQKSKLLDRVRRSKWRLERKLMNKLKKSDMDNRIADPAALVLLEKQLEMEVSTEKPPEEVVAPPPKVASTAVTSDTINSVALRNEGTFMHYVEQLQQFKLMHGHCNVQYNDQKYGSLGRWVKRQRYLYKLYVEGNPRSSMTPERIRILDQLGMIWDSQQAVWNERYEELLEFKRIHGHLKVPKEYGNGFGRWVGGQKSSYKKWKRGEITHAQPDRMAMLEAAGFGKLYPHLQENKK
ncbi:helicase domain protein [Nitzschia inconspicua]|uniref:Helicase domain protein n=1 Tax=Nitzschia inconspicua TaxID=303405 RepID=A0A9K3Q2K5_9STRA|nr:helicase domain protein [Nitzschia inconspicua]